MVKPHDEESVGLLYRISPYYPHIRDNALAAIGNTVLQTRGFIIGLEQKRNGLLAAGNLGIIATQ